MRNMDVNGSCAWSGVAAADRYECNHILTILSVRVPTYAKYARERELRMERRGAFVQTYRYKYLCYHVLLLKRPNQHSST